MCRSGVTGDDFHLYIDLLTNFLLSSILVQNTEPCFIHRFLLLINFFFVRVSKIILFFAVQASYEY